MKTIKTLHFCLLLTFFINCSRYTDLLEIKANDKNIVDVYHSQTNSVLLKELSASFSDSNDFEFHILDNNPKIRTHSFSDKMGTGTETTFKSQYENLNLTWTIRTFQNKPAVAARLVIKNIGIKPIRINRLNPLTMSKSVGGIFLDSKESLQYIDIEPETWAPKQMRVLDSSGIGKFVTGIATPDNKGAVIGCISFDRFRGVFEITDKRESHNVIGVNVYHDIDSHLRLDHNQMLSSEWVYIDCVNNVLDGLEQWAALAGKLNNAVVSDPPATGFYTWYYYRDYVSEKIMLDNAGFLAENRDKFPVNFVHIDWGWQRNFSSGDTTVNDKFPHGLRWLAQKISSYGFKPSIWVNPFMYTTPSADASLLHPDIFLKDTDKNLVEREPIRNIMAKAWGDAEYMLLDGVINVLDVSNPKAHDFLQDRYHWVRSMGYDMAMMDFIIYGRANLENGDTYKFTNLSTFEGIKKALYKARKGLGKGGNILGCGNFYEPCVGTSNLTRISYDATANWSCVKVACSDLILQYYMNNNLWTNYADGVFMRDKPSPYWGEYELDENGNKLPMYLNDDEAQFYTAVTGLSQAAVMYTEDIQLLKPDRQWLLSMILPIYKNGKFRPIDLFRTNFAKTLRLECEEGQRKWIVAAGINWTENRDEIGLDVGLLNLRETEKYHAFNIYKQEYIGLIAPNSQLGPINSHGVILINITADTKRPQVVGTNLHISQGGVEIADEIWHKNSKVLSIKVNSLYGRKGDIFVHVPSGFKFAKNTIGPSITQIKNVLKVPVVLDDEKLITLNFE
ncbi:alpha-galactosidase [candidate division KSB1 bacterium]|nr:alpha-galactosidase [candidate division KSB1 bacterium]